LVAPGSYRRAVILAQRREISKRGANAAIP
jgi:hypothetical protein